MATTSTTVEAGGRTVTITNPEKVFFPEAGYTKLDLVRYYIAVADGALRGVMNRPMVLKRFTGGATEPPFFQKRAPSNLPPWIETAHITFPSGRSADLVVCDEPSDLAWVVNLGCIDLNPWPVRANDVDHPDEFRVDLDPTPESAFAQVRDVAMMIRDVLAELGYRSFPKTSGSRGMHINVRIEPKWEFGQVRRAALALGREVERRMPGVATTAWWKEERRGVFNRLQPERARPHRRLRLLRPPDARRARLLSPRLGRSGGRRPGGVHAGDRPGALRRARRPRRGDRRRRALARTSARARGSSRTRGPRRRPVAAALPESRCRASTRPAKQAPPREPLG